MAKYGYIGAVPTQSNSSNTGLFNMTDVFKLIEAGQWALQGMDISYLVIAGGGGASTANSSGNRPGGGGGAGGYRNSYASESSGRNSATETPLFAGIGASLQVTVGGGGSANDGNYNRAGAKGSAPDPPTPPRRLRRARGEAPCSYSRGPRGRAGAYGIRGHPRPTGGVQTPVERPAGVSRVPADRSKVLCRYGRGVDERGGLDLKEG